MLNFLKKKPSTDVIYNVDLNPNGIVTMTTLEKNGEAMIDYTKHLKVYVRNEHGAIKGVMVALRRDEDGPNVVHVGTAFHNPRDKFDKERGYHIAYGRARKGMYQTHNERADLNRKIIKISKDQDFMVNFENRVRNYFKLSPKSDAIVYHTTSKLDDYLDKRDFHYTLENDGFDVAFKDTFGLS